MNKMNKCHVEPIKIFKGEVDSLCEIDETHRGILHLKEEEYNTYLRWILRLRLLARHRNQIHERNTCLSNEGVTVCSVPL